MKVTAERIAKMTFASIYPLYLNRLEKNGRTKEELNQVIEWLTGYDEDRFQEFIDQKTTFDIFYQQADMNPNAHLLKGVVCGYRIEDIADPLIRKGRFLDKLVDELARGRKMKKILREEKK